MGNRPTKIALLGPFGFGNLGDAAIQQAMISHIRKYAPSSDIFGISLDPEDTEKRHGIPCFPISRKPDEGWDTDEKSVATPQKRVFRKFHHVLIRIFLEFAIVWRSFKNIRGFQYLIISGGGQLDDYWGGPFSHPYTLLKWALLGRLAGTKVKFVSVGAGPINSRLSSRFLKTALRLASYRSYRDVYSRQLLAKNGFDLDDPVYPDLAHSLITGTSSLADDEKGIVGIGPMAYFYSGAWPEQDERVYKEYLKKLTLFACWVIEQGYRVRFFPGEVGADRDVIDQLKHQMKSTEKAGAVIDNSIETVDQLIDELARTDYVIASRFHGVLLAHVVGKPVIALSYHPKIDTLMKDMGHEEYCLNIDSFNVGQLIERFRCVVNTRDQMEKQIRHKELEYKQLLDQQYAQIFNH